MSKMKTVDELERNLISPHTIKKFELIEKYVESWAYRLLQLKICKGILFIDCMSNNGMYYDDQNNYIEGTALRVTKLLNKIAPQFPDKNIFIYFNDIDRIKIEELKKALSDIEFAKNVLFDTHVGDCNDYLKGIDLRSYSYFNTLLIYDPYQATIDWDAIRPFYANHTLSL